MSKPDYVFVDQGTIWLVQPRTRKLRRLLQSLVASDSNWFGDALVVEHRYVESLASGLQSEGHTVSRSH